LRSSLYNTLKEIEVKNRNKNRYYSLLAIFMTILCVTFIQGCATGIINASYDGNIERVKELIAEGVDVNTDYSGVKPLHNAAANGHVAIVKLLIESGANVNAATNQGITPLHNAAANGHVAIVKLLIESGANVNAVANNGFAVLHNAAINGHYETVELLLKSKANVNVKTKNGDTPLKLASSKGHNGIVKLLSKAAADDHDWEMAQKQNSRYWYKKYVESYPQGQYVEQAQGQINRLDEEEKERQARQKERARQQEKRRKSEQAAREAKEKAAREAFLKKIPDTVAKGAYVRAHRGNDGPLKSIGVAGEFIVQRLLYISSNRPGTRIEPQPKHPLIVEFIASLGRVESFKGAVGKLPVSANLALHAAYTGQTSDPATDAIRKANPKVWIRLVDPRLHIVSGGFTASGSLVVGAHRITLTDGGVMTQSTSEHAFFMSGTRVLVGNDAYAFDGNTWSTVRQ
jgi:hypothetical protein